MNQKEKPVKTAAIIPARLNSSRFPEKALFPILGKTLLQRTFESVLKCGFLDEIYIATDSEKILAHAESFKAKALLTGKDCKNGTQRLIEAVLRYKIKADIFINIQGDNPCICENTVFQTLQALQNDPKAQASTACARIKNLKDAASPHIVKCVFDKNFKTLYFSRSLIPFCKNFSSLKDLNPGKNMPDLKNTKNLDKTFFYHHIGIYAYRASFLPMLGQLEDTPLQQQEDLEQLKILEHGYTLKTALVAQAPISVDVPEDVLKVEKFLCRSNTFSSREA